MSMGVRKILKYAKYAIIPVLLFLYVSNFDSLIGPAIGSVSDQGSGAGNGGIQVIGVGFAATVSVTRPYLFGLVRLPVYAGDLGDISGIHDTFFTMLWVIGLIFMAWDIRSFFKGRTHHIPGFKYQYS